VLRDHPGRATGPRNSLDQGLLNANSRNDIGEIPHLLERWGRGLRICELKLLTGRLFAVKNGR
jgi:hypothetical protein